MRSTALGLVLLVSAVAPAQPVGQEQPARLHYATGESDYDRGRYVDALREFQIAYELSSRPALLYNIAVCQEALGHRAAAIAAFRQYLEASPDGIDRAAVASRVHLLEELERSDARPKRISRRGWFWGVLGGAVALVAGGVTLGVVLGTRSTSAQPQPLPDLVLR